MTNPSYYTAYEAYLADMARAEDERTAAEEAAYEEFLAARADDADAEIARQTAQVISIAKCRVCGFALDVTPRRDSVTCRNCGAVTSLGGQS